MLRRADVASQNKLADVQFHDLPRKHLRAPMALIEKGYSNMSDTLFGLA